MSERDIPYADHLIPARKGEHYSKLGTSRRRRNAASGKNVRGGSQPRTRYDPIDGSGFVCQFCGSEEAPEKRDSMFCRPCYNMRSVMRDMLRRSVERWELEKSFNEALIDKDAWQKMLGFYRFTWVRNKLKRQANTLTLFGLIIIAESLIIWFEVLQ